MSPEQLERHLCDLTPGALEELGHLLLERAARGRRAWADVDLGGETAESWDRLVADCRRRTAETLAAFAERMAELECD